MTHKGRKIYSCGDCGAPLGAGDLLTHDCLARQTRLADERARLNAAFRRVLLLLAALCVLLCALLLAVARKLGVI